MSLGTERRPSLNALSLKAAWTAVLVLAVAWVWYARDLEKHSGSWAGMVAAALAVSAGLVVVAAVGARRNAGSGGTPAATAFTVVLWGMGMLWYLVVGWMGYGNACGGSFALCSWECLNQAGSSWRMLSVLFLAAATVVPPVLLTVSRQARSRVVGGVAPALVIALVITAVLLVSPHGGTTQCFP
jgi:hypothetical protein